VQVSKIAQANFLVFDAAIANLSIGDPMASMAGILMGRWGRLPNGKSLAGFVAGWMGSFGALVAVYARAFRLCS
jgi:dolichol kinase